MKRLILAWALSALLAAAGLSHLASPGAYEEIIPPALGDPHAWVIGSGVVELLTALAIARLRSRRLAATFCVFLFIAVFPANVYAVTRGGYHQVPAMFQGRDVAIARLPLQGVLVVWAWRVAQAARPDSKSHQ